MGQTAGEVFAILAREHELGLLAFVRSCVPDPSTAEDIVQESLITAWKRLAEYERDRPFAAWLRGIARNKLLEHRRNTATGRRYVAWLTPELLDKVGEEQDRLISSLGDTFLDRLRPLKACVGELPPDDREILDQHYAHQRSCRGIAERLGLKHEAVKKRLQRIRNALRECILGKLAREATDG